MVLLFNRQGGSSSIRKRSSDDNDDNEIGAWSDNPSNKRVRRQTTTSFVSSRATTPSSISSDASESSDSPPNLQLSTTFESSSSSLCPSSHSVDSEATLPLPTPPPYVPAEAHAGTNSHNNNTITSPSPPTIINPNDNNTNNVAHHTTQYFTAISAAKSRLQLAQLMASQSQQNLSRAQIQYQTSHLELICAKEFLKKVEKKWGVIDVDCNNEPSHENNDLSTVYDGLLQLQSLSVDTEAKADDGHTSNQVKIQSIQVFNAGESIVNGRYNIYSPQQWQHTAVTNSTMPNKGPIYIHTKGPYLIQNEQYDVCLFQKAGYGDKVRWCIALVPCYFNNNEGNTNDEEKGDESNATQQNDGGEDRTRNFGLAYIYYWIEMNASSGDAAAIVYPPLSCKRDTSSSSSSSSWGVCHGTRPLPMLNDVSFGRKRWWQFWKH